MNKYIKDRNGVTLGWDGWWFFLDESTDEYLNFKAILWPAGYMHDNINALTYTVRTPAQQIMFDVTVDENGDRQQSLNPYVCSWLVKNAPGWGCPIEKRNVKSPSIFFTKVTHARAFRSWLSFQLSGFPPIPKDKK